MTYSLTKLALEECLEQLIDYRGKTPKKTESGIPLITAKVIKNGNILPPTEFIAENDYDSWMRRGIPKEGDVVLTVEAPLGEVAQLDSRKIALAQRVITLRGKKDLLNNTFLKYLLMSNAFQSALNGRASGTTVLGIKQSELRKIQLSFPPLSIQNKIANILSTLDDKIELNKKINQTLESIAQTIFKSWFIDFDPVHAKANANSEYEYDAIAKELGISRETLDLFPSEFENTELGVIPKGWEITPVSKISKLNSESWSHKNFPSVLNYIDLTSVKEGNITEISEYTYETAPSRARRILKRHDTIIGTVRPGNKSYAYINKEGLTGSTGFAVISPLKKHYRAFIYLYLTQENVIAHFAHIADGGAYPAIRPEIVTSLKLCMPTEDLLTAFQDKIAVLFDKISQNKEEQRILVKIRDMLLPKLISGEIEVSNLNLEPGYD